MTSRGAIAAALVALAAPARAGTLALDVRCDRPVDADALTAQLALELGGSGWIVAQGDADATLAVSTAGCAEDAPIELAFAAAAQRWTMTVDLSAQPRARRARLLAIVIAELLQPGHAPAGPVDAATAPLPPVPGPVRVPPLAPAIASTSASAIAPTGTRGAAPAIAAPIATVRAAFLGTARMFRDRQGFGAALSLALRARRVPHLAIDLDSGLDQLAWSHATFGAWRVELSAGARFELGRVDAELGVRAGASRAWLIAGSTEPTYVVAPSRAPWGGAAGVYLRGAVRLAAHALVLGDVAVLGSFAEAAFTTRWDVPSPPPAYDVTPLAGLTLNISAGIAFE